MALVFGLSTSSAHADDLTARRAAVKQQIAETQRDLSESSAALNKAGAAVERAEDSLAVAQDALARTKAELATAQAKDTAMAAKLKKAKVALAAAKKAVKVGEQRLAAKKAEAAEIVRTQYQQRTNLLPVAVLVENNSMGDLSTRLQWATTMFDTTQARIDELTAIKKQLDAKKARQAQLEKQVAADRVEAAATLATKKRLEAQAEQQEAAVDQLLRERRAVEQEAAAEVAEDKAQYAQLVKERSTVEQRIAARIAKAKAEAAAKRAAAKRAAARAAAAKSAARASGARQSAAKTPARSSARSSRSSSGGSNAGHGFSYPVSAGITSAYGMRFHPVLRYWKLHDGTDFGAGCGTAIRAPYAGRVAERYYNAGYGNRLMIDHGRVGGKYVTTGYNHAISYTVRVGQRVRRGQIIGYVGTTGYSTGCHLHLMVWLNGKVTNPTRWF